MFRTALISKLEFKISGLATTNCKNTKVLNLSIENQIKFKEECIKRIQEDIKVNGDNGFGYKKMQIEHIEEDIRKLKNENKRIINKKN